MVMLQALHIKGETSFDVFLPRLSGVAFLCATGVFLVSGTIFVRGYLEHIRLPSGRFRLIVAMNIITVVLTVVIAEIAVRAVARNYYGYEAIGTLVLKPKSWTAVRNHYQNMIREKRGDQLFYVKDSLLGWTLGSSKQSANGLYQSSAEGLRAPGEKSSFLSNIGHVDVALVGDSFTFGEEVAYEESYGYQLEQMLGAPFRVLNFGVPGYGLDQMLLRYERDVRPWNPKIAIFGFVSDDLRRTLWVYPFLGNFRWHNPYSKPRFILEEGDLRNVNRPSLTPDDIFSRESLAELPLVEYQKEYDPSEWERHFYHESYLIRLLQSWHSSPPVERDGTSEETLLSINARILREFVTLATQVGTIPLVVYLPVENELNRLSRHPLPKQVLERAGIAYVDPTSCLLEVNPSDRFAPINGHYSSQGNLAIAKCLLPVVYQVLRDAAPDRRMPNQ
ncbi:hypothetical protein YTPLAS72_02570 [Nitrospira sp.]|nr:hypothetical protein YTPLAS72_02570 [Nitrospira sp.]